MNSLQPELCVPLSGIVLRVKSAPPQSIVFTKAPCLMEQPYAAEQHRSCQIKGLQDAKSQQADNCPVGIPILQCTHSQMLMIIDRHSSRPQLSNMLCVPAVPQAELEESLQTLHAGLGLWLSIFISGIILPVCSSETIVLYWT